jgi:hypothetical protein
LEITLNIADELARQVIPDGQDPARGALEVPAPEGYCAVLLAESAVRQMLGFEMRMEAQNSLKQHRVHLPYDATDLEQDRAPARKAHKNS